MLAASAQSVAESRALLRAEDFDELVRLHQKRIYRVLYSILRDPDAADTLTQDCFLRAYQHRANFRGESRVETWLIRIAVNLATDHLRSRKRAFWSFLKSTDSDGAGEPEPARDAPSAERVLVARQRALLVWQAAAELPPQQRAVFHLRFAEEMSLEEIAEATQLEVGTVKSHLHRALLTVRRKVNEWESR